MAHYGGHKLWKEVYEKLAGRNVYFDTAFTLNQISKDLFVKILDKHSVDKVLFATDSPWSDLGRDINILKSFGLKKEDLNKIFYKNALKLLNLKV